MFPSSVLPCIHSFLPAAGAPKEQTVQGSGLSARDVVKDWRVILVMHLYESTRMRILMTLMNSHDTDMRVSESLLREWELLAAVRHAPLVSVHAEIYLFSKTVETIKKTEHWNNSKLTPISYLGLSLPVAAPPPEPLGTDTTILSDWNFL